MAPTLHWPESTDYGAASSSFGDAASHATSALPTFLDEMRRLQTSDGSGGATDTCALLCNNMRCDDPNWASFTCDNMVAIQCGHCVGCMCESPAGPLGTGFVLLIIAGVAWFISLFCYIGYRRIAVRECDEVLDGEKPPRRSEVDDFDELDTSQQQIVKRRRRYAYSCLNFLFPFIAFCCPMLHDNIDEGMYNVRRTIYDGFYECAENFNLVKARTKEGVRRGAEKAKQGIVKAGELTKQATSGVINTVEGAAGSTVGAVVAASTKVVESLEDVNITGFSVKNMTQFEHGKQTTSDKSTARGGTNVIMYNKPLLEEDEDEEGGGGGGGAGTRPRRMSLEEELHFQKQVASIAAALVVVAQGGTATITGTAEEIEMAAERLEIAATRARVAVAARTGRAFLPLRLPGVTDGAGSSSSAGGGGEGTSSSNGGASEEELRTVRLELRDKEGEITRLQRRLLALQAQYEEAAAAALERGESANTTIRKVREEVDHLTKEVVQEVTRGEGQAEEAIRTARQSFAGRRVSFVGGATSPGGADKPRTSFLEVYQRNSQRHEEGRDSWRDEGDEEDEEDDEKAKAAASPPPRQRARCASAGVSTLPQLAEGDSARDSSTSQEGGGGGAAPAAVPAKKPRESKLTFGRPKLFGGSGLLGAKGGKKDGDEGSGSGSSFVGLSDYGGSLPLTPKEEAKKAERSERLRKLEEAQAKAEEAAKLAAEQLAEHEKSAAERSRSASMLQEGEEGEADPAAPPPASAPPPRQSIFKRMSSVFSGSQPGGLVAQPAIAMDDLSLSAGSTSAEPPKLMHSGSSMMAGLGGGRGSGGSSEGEAPEAAAPEQAGSSRLSSSEPGSPRWVQLLEEYKEQLSQIEEWLATEPTEEELADGSAMEKAMTLITARDELTAKIEQLEAVASAHGALGGRLEKRTTSFSANI